MTSKETEFRRELAALMRKWDVTIDIDDSDAKFEVFFGPACSPELKISFGRGYLTAEVIYPEEER